MGVGVDVDEGQRAALVARRGGGRAGHVAARAGLEVPFVRHDLGERHHAGAHGLAPDPRAPVVRIRLEPLELVDEGVVAADKALSAHRAVAARRGIAELVQPPEAGDEAVADPRRAARPGRRRLPDPQLRRAPRRRRLHRALSGRHDLVREVQPARLRDQRGQVERASEARVHVVCDRVEVVRLEKRQHLMQPVRPRVEVGADDARPARGVRPQRVDHAAQLRERGGGLLRRELELELVACKRDPLGVSETDS